MADPGRQTDRQTKSSRWAFTAYQAQWALFESMPPGIAEWGWQREICPKTNNPHYQGYLRLTQQQRFAWLAKLLPGVHLEVAKNWDALIQYCKKEETGVPGTQVHRTSSIETHFQYAETLAKRIMELHNKCGIMSTWTNDNALGQINDFARLDIRAGKRYVAWIISNPQWAAMWRPYWRDFIMSFSNIDATQAHTPPSPCSPFSESPPPHYRSTEP